MIDLPPPMADSQYNPSSNRRFLLTTSEDNGFPILAMAILCILATVFLLISYYVFLNKCHCFFSRFSRQAHHNPTTSSNSPPFSLSSPIHNRGLDQILIQNIPVFQYNIKGGENRGGKEWNECVVCLSDFRDQEMLRILPRCGHAFHLDCIDIWLQTNANCPLCRTSISGRRRFPADLIVAPTSSPHPMIGDEDFVVIELAGGSETQTPGNPLPVVDEVNYRRKSSRQRVSMMGDELCIGVREKDDDFSSVQAIRRSFSMDSAVDRQVYLWVQEIAETTREASSSRAIRSFFSFGHGQRGSRNWVLPVEF